MSSITDYLLVFAIGGAICVIGQLLMSLTRLTPARILVIFVTAGVVLTAVGLYKPIVELGGAGATVPLTGFGLRQADVQSGAKCQLRCERLRLCGDRNEQLVPAEN